MKTETMKVTEWSNPFYGTIKTYNVSDKEVKVIKTEMVIINMN